MYITAKELKTGIIVSCFFLLTTIAGAHGLSSGILNSGEPMVAPEQLLIDEMAPDSLLSATPFQPDSLLTPVMEIRDTLKMEPEMAPDSPDTLQTEMTPLKKSLPPPEIIHSPRKASFYSALLPGLGQAYNKKYWKIPIIYGGFAALGYFIGWNNKVFNTSRQAYLDLTDTIPETDSYMKLKQIIYYDLTKPSDVASLKQALISSQDYYRRNRDLLIIVTALFYGLNIVDASVDAHFFNFDISEDLTVRVEPVLRQTMNQNIFCLNCSFRF